MSADPKPFECQHCGAGFTINAFLTDHLKEAHVEGGEYGCGECSCIFNHADKLQAHQVQQHGYMESLPFSKPKQPVEVDTRCKFCGITFHNQILFKSHIRRKHADEYESSEEEEEEDEDEDSDTNTDKPVAKEVPTTNGNTLSSDSNAAADSKKTKEVQESGDIDDSSSHQNNNKNNYKRLSKVQEAESDASGSSRANERGSKNFGRGARKSVKPLQPYSDDDDSGDKNRSRYTGSQDNNESSNDVTNGYEDEQHNDTNEDMFQPVTNFMIQGDYDMEPEEAHMKSTNIEKLINSIPDDDEPPIQACDLCGSAYANLESLLSHKRTNHVAGGKFPCEQCTCVFASRPELIVHSDIFHRTISLATPDFSLSSCMEPQQVQQHIAIIACDLCGESFEDDLQLTLHKMRNHVARGHLCPSCPCSFMTDHDLSVHQQQIHGHFSDMQYSSNIPSMSNNQSKESYCTLCCEDFKTPSAYRHHMKACHVPNGKFCCSECPCSFSSNISLLAHTKKHKKAQKAMPVSRTTNSYNHDSMQICACEICGVNFLNSTDYIEHKEESHVQGGQFGCGDCSCIFANFESLKKHRKLFHSGKSSSAVVTPVSNYEIIQQPFQLSDSFYLPMDNQRPTRVKPTHDCTLCGITLSSKAILKVHLQKSHVSKGYQCKFCTCCFGSLNGIKSHISQYHKNVPNSEESYTPPPKRGKNASPSKLNSAAEESEFKCTECDWTLADATDFQNHKIQFHGFKPNSSSSDAVDAIKDILSNDDDLTCSACNLTFKRPSETMSHRKRNHIVGGKFPCTRCKCVYSNLGSLQAHEIAKHKDELVSTPKAPGKTSLPSTSSSSSVPPPRSKPSGGREFVCNLCGRSYALYASLCAHKKRSHKSSGKPCSYCTCIFANQQDLDLHWKKYHRHVKFTPEPQLLDIAKRGRGRPKRNDAGAPAGLKFTCQYSKCGAQCRNQSSLTNHIKKYHAAPVEIVTIDESFKCDSCKAVFDSKEELKVHKETVHEYDAIKMAIENPTVTSAGKYLCNFCSTVFSRLSAMVAHVKTFHVDENKFICTECPNSDEFDTIKDLELHRKRFHEVVLPPPYLMDEGHQDYEEDNVPIITSCTSLSTTGYEKPKQPQCELCGRIFLRSRSLWSHRKRSHVTGGDHGCEQCSCGFATSRGLLNHQLIYHGIRSERLHSKNEDGWLIDCEFCEETFTSNRSMESHKKRAHVTGGEFPCADCYNIYATQTSLNIHRIKKHGLELPELPPSSVQEPKRKAFFESLFQPRSQKFPRSREPGLGQKNNRNLEAPPPDADDGYDYEPPPTPPEPDMDTEMDYVPPNDSSLKPVPEHPARATAASRKAVPQTVAPKSSPQNQNPLRRHACDICNLTFGFLRFLISHRRMRHSIEDTQCIICKATFATTDSLIDHTIKAHDSQEPSSLSSKTQTEYPCDLCGMVYTLSSSLVMHKSTAHVANGKFPCPQCPCVFGTANGLTNHKTAHSLRNKMIPKQQQASVSSTEHPPMEENQSPPRKRGRPSRQPLLPPSPALPPQQKKGVARKKTALPPPASKTSKSSDIIGMAFSAAMNSTVPDATPRCSTCKRSDFPSISALGKHEMDCRKRSSSRLPLSPVKVLPGSSRTTPSSSKSTPGPAKATPGSRKSAGAAGKPTPAKKTGRPPMSCKFCTRKFTLQSTLLDHMKKKHGSNEDANAPSTKYVEQIDLDSDGGDDFYGGAKESPREPTPPPPPPPPPPKPKRRTKFPCKECNIIYKTKRVRETHRLICHAKNGTINCDKCSCKFNVALGLHFHKLYGHKVKDSNKKRLVKNKENAKIKDGSKKGGSKKGGSKRGKKLIKKKKKGYEKGFFSPRTLKNRERLINWTETMHPCKVCAMKFRVTSKLARHEKINHPGAPEYLCEKCPSMTSLSKELNYHEEIYHSDYLSMNEAIALRKKHSKKTDATTLTKPKSIIKLKPFKADENLPLDLSTVMASYSCSGFTGSLFEQEQTGLRIKENILRRRLRRRKGIHMCRVCRMMFMTKRALSNHLKVHVGEKPFKCRFCGVMFRQYGAYCFHKKKHFALNAGKKEAVERNPLGRCSYCKATFRTVTLADIHFEEVHPELKFLDMCEQASNLWKETTNLKSGDNALLF